MQHEANKLVENRSTRAALSAVATDLETADDDVKSAIALNLAFQPVKKIALEFGNLTASQTGHVDVIALRTTLVEMLLPLHVHEIQFVDEAMALQQA